MEYLQLPRRRVTEYFGVARPTLYRWLHSIDDPEPKTFPAANKTPVDIAALVWEIAKNNLDWGRFKIANQLKLLGIFLAASTVRNILNRPAPRNQAAAACTPTEHSEVSDPRSVPAFYPNHVWSLDFLTVSLWGLWETYVLVARDAA